MLRTELVASTGSRTNRTQTEIEKQVCGGSVTGEESVVRREFARIERVN